MTISLGLHQQLREEDIEKLQLYREDLKVAYDKQRSPGWAAMQFKEKHGYFPPDDWAKNAVFGEKPTRKQRSLYKKHLSAIADRLSKEPKWIDRYLRLEFSRSCK